MYKWMCSLAVGGISFEKKLYIFLGKFYFLSKMGGA